MADDEALRARRSRAHRAGDHSLCRPGRCAALAVVPDVGTDEEPTTVTASVLAYVATIPLHAGDPRAPLCAAAVRLAQAIDGGGVRELPALVRELRTWIEWCSDFGRAADGLEALRARHAQRRVELILGGLGGAS